MRDYEEKRKIKIKARKVAEDSKPRHVPVNEVPVFIRPGLIVYTNCPSKIEAVRAKYAGR